MPKLLQRLRAALKGWNSGDWVNSNLPGNRYNSRRSDISWNPGSQIDYGALAGDLWKSSVCQAILNWIIRAWPESYPCVKKLDAGGKKVIVPGHALTEILLNPNEFDDDTALWGGTIISFWCDGNAYWRINRTRGGQIGEFEYVPHWAIEPYRSEGSTKPGPERYDLSTTEGVIPLAPYDVVHFRFGRHPYNDLLGMSPWASVNEEVYTDKEAANYTASMLRNRGRAWMIVSPDGEDVGFEDSDQVRDTIEQRTTGDNRNRVLVLDVPAKITLPPPHKDMGMLDVRRFPESRAAALSGIPGMVVGFASAQERSTFSNTDQAEGAAWNTLVAVQRMMGRQLTKQTLWTKENQAGWLGKGENPRHFFAGFDYSEVRALQPDKNAEADRVVKLYEAGILDDDEARAEIDYEPFTAKQRAAIEARREAARAQSQPQAVTDPNAPQPQPKPKALSPRDTETPGKTQKEAEAEPEWEVIEIIPFDLPANLTGAGAETETESAPEATEKEE